MPWTCDHCETQNQIEVSKCEVCGADRPERPAWNCPNCETVNPGLAEKCEVCGVDQSSADLLPQIPAKPKGLAIAGEMQTAAWQVPGNLRYVAEDKIPVPKIRKPAGPLDYLVVRPIRNLLRSFMSLTAERKKRWIKTAIVAGAVAMFVYGTAGWLTFFLIFSGWNWIRYSTTKKFREKIDRWLEAKDLDEGEYKLEKRLVEHYEEGHHFAIESITFSSVENKLGSLDRAGNFQQWMVETGEKKRGGKLFEARFQKAVLGERGIYTLELGQQIIVYGPGRDFESESTAQRKKTITLPIPAGPDSPLVLSPRQGFLAIGTTSGTVFIWDVRTFSQNMYSGDMAGQIMAIDIFKSERHLIAGTQRGQVAVWNIETRIAEFMDIRMGKEVRAVAASPGGELFAAAYDDGEVRVWVGKPPKEIFRINLSDFGEGDGSIEFAHKISFISGSEDLLTADHKGDIHRWDIRSGHNAPIKTYPAKGDSSRALAVSHDGRWLAAGGQEGEITIFDLR